MREMSQAEVYSRTVDRLEPNIHPIDLDGAAASIAISLKRIANALDRIADTMAERNVP